MATYYRHTREVNKIVPYEFDCEQCHKSSGKLKAYIVGSSEMNLNSRKISDKRSQILQERAEENLERTYARVRKDVEKDIFSEEFEDHCPHCGKPQSWSLAGMQDLYMVYGIVGIIVGGFLALYFWFNNAHIVVALMTLILGGLIGLFVAFIRIFIKKNQTKNVEKKLPKIYWED